MTVEELKQQRLVSRARDTAGSRRAVIAKHLPTYEDQFGSGRKGETA